MEDARDAIELQNALAMRCYEQCDANSLANIFTENAWQMPPNSPPLVGRTAIRNFWRDAFHWGAWHFDLQVQEVSSGGHIAVERGRYIVKFKAGNAAPPGMLSFEDRGNYLVHWQREPDGVWRIAADAPVSEVPLK
jgi:uncharacterized protein (TIGR02246 family)